MSYARNIKRELCGLPPTERCCLTAELLGAVCFGAFVRENQLLIKTENATIAKRLFFLTKSCFGMQAAIISPTAKNSVYTVRIADVPMLPEVLEDLRLVKNSRDMKNFISFRPESDLVRKECCKRAFLRGAFLAAGSCSDPDKGYHLELVTNHHRLSRCTMDLLAQLDIAAKCIVRKSNYVIYLKGAEKICDFLGYIGATHARLEFENVRILKELKNDVNRRSNCDLANLNKMLSAAYAQQDAIRKIQRTIGIETLDSDLRELAYLRLENSEMSLKELGEKLSRPISKSGVNHRLKKLVEIADSLKEKEV